MKIVSDIPTKAGKRKLVMLLEPNEFVLVIKEDRHYKLGYPVEDIMASHILSEAHEVSWCSIEQKWLGNHD